MRKIIFTLLMPAIAAAGSAQVPECSGSSAENSKHDYYIMEGDYMIHYYVEIKSEKQLKSPALKKLLGNALVEYKQRIAVLKK